MIPILTRPKILALKNRMRLHQLGIKDVGMGALALAVVAMIHSASFSLGIQLRTEQEVRLAVEVFFAAFFCVSLAASIVNSFHIIAHAQDSELIRYMPVKRNSLFFGRFIEVVLASIWLYIVFAFPFWSGIVLAHSVAYVTVLVPVVLTFVSIISAAALGLLLVVTMLRVFKVETLISIFLCLFFCSLLYVLVKSPKIGSVDYVSLADETLSWFRQFRPTTGLAEVSSALILGESVRIKSIAHGLFFLLVFTAAAKIAYDLFENRVWERIVNLRSKSASRPNLVERFGARILSDNLQLRAFLSKELRYFLRDASQVMHLIVVFALAAFYLSNFKKIKNIEVQQEIYQDLLSVGLAVGVLGIVGFVLLTVSVRFAFPLISLEGRSVEILKFMPVTGEMILKRKAQASFFGLGLLSVFVNLLGCYCASLSVNSSLYVLAIGLIISYGLAGISVGVGAMYTKFEWDSPSEVYASFGSLVCICLSAGFIAAALLPSSIALLVIKVPEYQGVSFGFGFSVVCVLGTLYIARAASNLSLRSGLSVLNERLA